MICSADSVHVALGTVRVPGLWMVIGKSHSTLTDKILSHWKEALAARPLYLLLTWIVCSDWSRGHGQALVKGKINVLAWYGEESRGHG